MDTLDVGLGCGPWTRGRANVSSAHTQTQWFRQHQVMYVYRRDSPASTRQVCLQSCSLGCSSCYSRRLSSVIPLNVLDARSYERLLCTHTDAVVSSTQSDIHVSERLFSEHTTGVSPERLAWVVEPLLASSVFRNFAERSGPAVVRTFSPHTPTRGDLVDTK